MERRTLLTAAVVGSLLVAFGGTVYAAMGRGGGSAGAQVTASAAAEDGASSSTTPPAAGPGWRDDENDDDGAQGRRNLGGGRGHLADAAAYLGLSPDELVAELVSGSTLADVAEAQGKSVAGLEETLVQSERSELDAAVAAGMLTEARASELLAERRSRVDDLVHGRYGLGRGPERDHGDRDARPGGLGDPV